MKYNVHIEKVCEHCWIIRLFKAPLQYGDKYFWCATLKIDGDTCEYKAVLNAPPHESTAVIIQALKNEGLVYRIVERIKNGKSISFKKRL